ncbi:MAG: GNAT family N-acetyltransferase [Pseudomonadota bacterium]
MPIIAERYNDATDRQAWTQLLQKAARRNILTRRDFLDYHGDRLEDFSLVFRDGPGGPMQGLLPGAIHPQDPSRVTCHGGSSLGGMIFKKPASPQQTADAFQAAALVWREHGVASLSYKTTPSFFDTQPDETDIAIVSQCASTTAKKLWQAIDTQKPLNFSSGLDREARSASKKGFTAQWSVEGDALDAMYKMVRENLADRHEAEPLHSLAEVKTLHHTLGPASVVLLVRDANNAPAAAAWMLRYAEDAWHPQYIASTPVGRRSNAVKLLLMTALERCRDEKVRWLSLGTSSGDGAFGVDDTLFQFKRRFGAGAFIQHFFEIEIDALIASS